MRAKQEPSLWVKLPEEEVAEVINGRWRTPRKQALIALAALGLLLVTGLTIIEYIEGMWQQVVYLVPIGAGTMIVVLKALSVPSWYTEAAKTALENMSVRVVDVPIIKKS